jgi:ABC-2 type transport system permease protein
MATIDLSTRDPELHLVAPRQPVTAHLRDIWKFRELWWQLVRKELKVRYKRSVLGFVWTMVNPLFMLLVYSVAFGILGTAFKDYQVWLLIGLLLWNLFASSLLAGTTSITGNSYLVNKVRFPREILPLASVGAALVHFFLQSLMLVAVLGALRVPVEWRYLWLLPFALLALVIVASAFAVFLSALNVYARDTQHLLELAMLAWFWLTPILYAYDLVSTKLTAHHLPAGLQLINPLTPVVVTFQRVLYGKAALTKPRIDPVTGKQVLNAAGRPVSDVTQRLLPNVNEWWYARNIGIVLVVGAVLFLLAIKMFDRAEGNFAEVM